MSKRHSILLLSILLLMSTSLLSKDIVINNPAYKVSISGISHISKIELNDKETKLHIHSVFLPNWWVKFEKGLYIEDCETNEKFYPTDIINGEFDKEIYMPASGDSTFVLVFPPLDRKVKKINFHEPQNTYIYDISLDPNAKKADKSVVSAEVQKWLDSELAKEKRKSLINLQSDEFFTDSPARLVGYIKGYDPRVGISTAIIYLSNDITREDMPTVVQIHPDGRFESTLTLKYPQLLYLSLPYRANLYFYIEPGQTLSMVLDWEEFLLADRNRNIQYKFKDIEYKGASAQVNKEMLLVASELPNNSFDKAYNEEARKVLPMAYKTMLDELVAPYQAGLQQLSADKKIGETAAAILSLDLAVQKGSILFEYIGDYTEYGRNKEKIIPKEFYSFLQDIPHNDHRLLATSQFSTFINRLEYNDFFRPIFQVINKQPKPEVSIDEYLFGTLKLAKSKEDEEVIELGKKLTDENGQFSITEENNEDFERWKELMTAFSEKYKKESEEYAKIYIAPTAMSKSDEQRLTWHMQDSILANELNIESGFLSDIIKSRSIQFRIEHFNKEDAMGMLQSYNKFVSTPFLKSEAQRLFDKKYHPDANLAQELPKGKGTDIIRKIIDPFEGKYVVVDFWATWCGPCVKGIKQTKKLREQYANHPEIAFVFVSDEKMSDNYTNFVAEQEMTNNFNISEDDFKYLRELFKFNGIPRYVLVDKDGKILNNDFNGYNMEHELKKIIGKQ